MTGNVSVSPSPFRFAQISQMVTAAIIRAKVKDLSWKQTICVLSGSAVTLYLVVSWLFPAASEETLEKARQDVPKYRRIKSSRPRTFSSTKSWARTFTSTYNLGIPYPELSSESEEEGVFNADPNYIPDYIHIAKKTKEVKAEPISTDIAQNENSQQAVENTNNEGGMGGYEFVEKKSDHGEYAHFECPDPENEKHQGRFTKEPSEQPVFVKDNEDEFKEPLYPPGKNSLDNLRERYQRGELPSTLRLCLVDQAETEQKKALTY